MTRTIDLRKKSKTTSNIPDNSEFQQNPLVTLLIGFITGMIFTGVVIKATSTNLPPIELPEEYYLIDKNDNLKGYWKQDTLVIEFDNPNNQ